MKSKISSIILIVIGAFAVIFAAGAFVYNSVAESRRYDDAVSAVAKIMESIPEVEERVPSERGNNMMPSLEIDGTNYVALVEFPTYRFVMPVVSTWHSSYIDSVPCRYQGSVYDNTLVIGSSDEEGQMRFAEELEVGDFMYLTDMSGGKYRFAVEAIHHSDEISEERLAQGDFDLTIFVKSSGNSEYLLIRCNSEMSANNEFANQENQE